MIRYSQAKNIAKDQTQTLIEVLMISLIVL